MIQTIVTYLNARLATLGRIDRTYCLTERRKREGDAVATIPYEYTGAGEFRAVDIDNGSSSWWRGRSGFTLEPVNVVGRAVKQQQGSYPLRVVVLLRRKDSVADDVFMPSRLAEDVANVLNFDNGDLQTLLGAWSVSSRTSGGEYDSTRVWVDEFQTPVPDLDYRLCMVAVDVTVDVVADYKCWQNECGTDPDILRLFNFCDPSVAARLTPEQVECLQAAFPVPCEDAEWTLEDTNGTPLSSGSIPSGGSAVIVAPDATVTRDGLPYASVPSGGSVDVPIDPTYDVLADSVANVHYIGLALVGTPTSGQWEITRITVILGGSQVVETAVGPWDDRLTLIYT